MTRERTGLFAAAAALLVVLCPRGASAHGVWAHVHVTGWAVENLEEGELRDFLAEPEVMNAALFGAAFTDSGYAPGMAPVEEDFKGRAHAYGEHTHWEPFVQDFVAWIRANDPPPWSDLESRKRVAFMMGCAAHGLQDEIFDSLFLMQTRAHDGAGQEAADPAMDGFLSLDGHLRFFPKPYFPAETLVELYEVLAADVTAEDMERAVRMMTSIYLNERTGPTITASLGRDNEEKIPWAREHYLDPAVPGSLRSEILPTAAYFEALWERVHGRFEHAAAVTHTFPNPPRRLLGAEAEAPDSWVTIVLGMGLKGRTATLTWAERGGSEVAFDLEGTRWGGLGTWGRLLTLRPQADLGAGAWHEVSLEPGMELMDGSTLAEAFTFAFQAPCGGTDEDACPELSGLEVASIDSPDAGTAEDAADSADTAADAGTDPGTDPGADSVDDTGESPDAGAEEPQIRSASGCGLARSAPRSGTAWALLLLVVFLRRGRRRV